MRTRWEYAQVVAVTYCEPDGGIVIEGYRYQQKAWLHQADAPPQELCHVNYPLSPEDQLSWSRILNELGADGWEMVTVSLSRSGVSLNTTGWDSTSEPLQTTYHFKRPVI